MEIIDNRNAFLPVEKYREPVKKAFKPLFDRVLLKRVEEEAKGSIVIPDQYRQHSNKGIVIETGEFFVMGGQIFKVADILNPGDVVLFGEYNAESFFMNDEEFFIVRIQDIRGKEVDARS